jgi:hypothetical protein
MEPYCCPAAKLRPCGPTTMSWSLGTNFTLVTAKGLRAGRPITLQAIADQVALNATILQDVVPIPTVVRLSAQQNSLRLAYPTMVKGYKTLLDGTVCEEAIGVPVIVPKEQREEQRARVAAGLAGPWLPGIIAAANDTMTDDAIVSITFTSVVLVD